MIVLPRVGSVGLCAVHKKEDAPGVDLRLNDGSLRLIAVAYHVRHAKSRLVASRGTGEPAATSRAIGQIPSHGDAAAVALAVLVVVGNEFAVRFAGSMHSQPFGAFGCVVELRSVVEPKSRPHIQLRRLTTTGWASRFRKGAQ